MKQQQLELFGGWVQELIFKYDREQPEEVIKLRGKSAVWSAEDARSWMRYALQRAVEKVCYFFVKT